MPKHIVMLIAAVVSLIIGVAGFIFMERYEKLELASCLVGVFGLGSSMVCGIVALVLYLCF